MITTKLPPELFFFFFFNSAKCYQGVNLSSFYFWSSWKCIQVLIFTHHPSEESFSDLLGFSFINRIVFCLFGCFGLLVCKDVKKKKKKEDFKKKKKIQNCHLHCGFHVKPKCIAAVCFLGLCSCSPLAEKQEGRGFRLTQHPSFPLAPPALTPTQESRVGIFPHGGTELSVLWFVSFLFFFFGSQAVTASFRKLLRQSVCCLFLSKVWNLCMP